jgi:hypothetical protein
MSRHWVVLATWCLAVAFASICQAAAIRTVVLNGRQAPGAPAGVKFTSLGLPVLNDAGQAAFRATTSVDLIDRGIWSDSSGSLSLVARKGDQAPAMPTGVAFDSFSISLTPLLSDAGQTTFWASVSGSGVTALNDRGFWSGTMTGVASVVREGDQAPGLESGARFFTLNGPLQSKSGKIAFHAAVTSPNDESIWSGSPGDLSLAAREGDQAPGTPSGVLFSSFHQTVPINEAGQIAIRAVLKGPGVDSNTDVGIFSTRAGGLELVARKGSAAPGLATSAYFTSLDSPTINEFGRTAFVAGMEGEGIDETNSIGIWSEGAGDLALVTRRGEQAPGTPAGAFFSSFDSPLMFGSGRTVFIASVEGSGVDLTNNKGIWAETDNGLVLVVRNGDLAPGLPAGARFSFGIGSIALNNNGQIAFSAAATDAQGLIYGGIWATDPRGELKLVASTNDVLEVSPGELRTISGVGQHGSTGGSDGRPSGFNDLGQLAFHASFTDGSSGIFVSNAVAVPEPKALVLVMASVICVSLRVRRRKP